MRFRIVHTIRSESTSIVRSFIQYNIRNIGNYWDKVCHTKQLKYIPFYHPEAYSRAQNIINTFSDANL